VLPWGRSLSIFEDMLNYTDALRALIKDIVRVERGTFGHVRVEEIGVAFTMVRKPGTGGTLAKIVPLRFENGALEEEIRGRRYRKQQCRFEGRDLLYLLFFYMPRFQELSLEEKIRTICHELYHINPHFNGDIRRFPGGKYAHGPSRRSYDAAFEPAVQHFLRYGLDIRRHFFVDLNYNELAHKHGPLMGSRYPMPKLIPEEQFTPDQAPAAKPPPPPQPEPQLPPQPQTKPRPPKKSRSGSKRKKRRRS
jgi:hypothetical protein